MTAPPQPPSAEVYGTFAGQIDQAAVQRIFQNCAGAMAPPVSTAKVHLLFQSFGGVVGDGVCLYNFFRSLPIGLALYNAGAVQSIATIAYLGARERKASAHATFLLHRAHTNEQAATAARLKVRTQSLSLDDEVIESILREHIQLTRRQWRHLDNHDLTLSASEALGIGLTTEIADFLPPHGTRIYAV
jgi:ATP-dependent protease ClpP protease subunit